MKIQILKYIDGVEFILTDPHGKETSYSFTDDADYSGLVKMFHQLGYHNVSFRDVY